MNLSPCLNKLVFRQNLPIKEEVTFFKNFNRVLNELRSTNISRKNKPRMLQGKRKQKTGPTISSCSLARLNPFLSDLNGIRSPDDFGYPSGTAVLRAAVTVSSNSGGYLAQSFHPFLSGYTFIPANVTGGTVTWSGGSFVSMPQNNAMINLASMMRVVAYGVRVTTESALTAASGHIWIAALPLDIASSSPYYDWPTNEAGFAQMPVSEKFTLVELAERPLIAPGRPLDDGIYRFRDISAGDETTKTSVGVESSPGWCAIGIFGSGVPVSAGCINVEFIMHVEFVHDGSTAYGFIDTIPGLYDPAAMLSNSRVSALAPVGLLENTVDSVEKASVAASSIMARGARLITGVSSAYRAAGRIMTSLGYNRAPASSPFAQIEYNQAY